jgi:hypothetical protein
MHSAREALRWMAQASWQAAWVGSQLAASAHSSSWEQLQQMGLTAQQLMLLLMPACWGQTSLMLLQTMRGMVAMTSSLHVIGVQQQQKQCLLMWTWQMHSMSSSRMKGHLTGLPSQVGRLMRIRRLSQQMHRQQRVRAQLLVMRALLLVCGSSVVGVAVQLLVRLALAVLVATLTPMRP